MAEFKVVTDSNADLPEEYVKEHKIGIMPLSYSIGGKEYGKNAELDWHEFYRLMREEHALPSTSQVNPSEAKEFFEEYIAEGATEILALAFSSALSGTYQSIHLAAEEVMEDHPEVKIIVIDSLGASLGEGLYVNKAVTLRSEGKSMDETAAYLEEHKQNFVHVFTVDDLYHLYRGGRVSKTTAVVGTLINVKPILHVDENGKLTAIGKVRGRKKSLHTLVDIMEEKTKGYVPENTVVYISHGDALEDAKIVKEEVKKRFGIEQFVINRVGPSIGAHSGPGTIALFFEGNDRK